MNSGSGGNLQFEDVIAAAENGTLPPGEVTWMVKGGAKLAESAVMVKLICEGLTAIVCATPRRMPIMAESRNRA